MKILTTGNPTYGVAQAISTVLGGDFASRSNGFDLCTPEGRWNLAEKSLDYDVFINCASLWQFNQCLVLESIWKRWQEAEKAGRIINIGSTADTGVRSGAWVYPVEKKALRDLSRNLTYSTIAGSGIHMTYISFGYIPTPKVVEKHPTKRMIDPVYVAQVIQWVAMQPIGVNVNELSIDPIQGVGGTSR